jgi:hypothetical protein
LSAVGILSSAGAAKAGTAVLGNGSQLRSPQQIAENKRSHTTGAGKWSAATFPQDLGIHFMSFTFHKMQFGGGSDQPIQIGSGSVLLPVPTNLIDALNMQYNDIELGMVGGIVANSGEKVKEAINTIKDLTESKSTMRDAWDSGTKSIMNAVNVVKSDIANGGELTTGIFREGTNPLAVGLNRLFGNIPNPNLMTMFRGVGLRSHSFEWKLAPRNEEESRQLSKIIKIFKNASLPGTRAGGQLLTFPYQVQIAIAGTSTITDQTGMRKSHYNPLIEFKPVVIKSIAANYTPDNTPSFFAGTGHPTATSLRLEFQETQIHTRADYEQAGLFSEQGNVE